MMTRPKFNIVRPDGATYGGRLPDNPPPSPTPIAPAAYKPQEYNPGLHKIHYDKKGKPIAGVAKPAPQSIDELIARLRAQFPHLPTAELRRMAEMILAGGSVPAPGNAAPSPGPGQQQPAAGERVPFGPAGTVQPINQELVTGPAAQAQKKSGHGYIKIGNTWMPESHIEQAQLKADAYREQLEQQRQMAAIEHQQAQAEQALEDKRRQLEAMQLDDQIRRLEGVIRNQALGPRSPMRPIPGREYPQQGVQ